MIPVKTPGGIHRFLCVDVDGGGAKGLNVGTSIYGWCNFAGHGSKSRERKKNNQCI
jgi:hypothetical protein